MRAGYPVAADGHAPQNRLRLGEHMTARRTAIAALLVAAIGLVAIPVAPTLHEFLASDECLDQEGSYDYTRQRCDFVDGHRFNPYFARHPVRTPVSLSMALAASIAAYVLRRPTPRAAA